MKSNQAYRQNQVKGKFKMRILGIETSCDETGVAVYCQSAGLLAHQVHSQVDLHARYGGVVPELASRDHVRRLPPMIEETLAMARITRHALSGVAYTRGPGLVGALLTGAAFGRSLAWGLGIPAIGVHHMEAHLLAPMLDAKCPPAFPFVALLVSGGHTMLVLAAGTGRYRLLGTTLDDAVGEAFDKTATLLGLPYPGGPALERLAKLGDPDRFRFPRPMTDRPGLDFSFSGLKTHARNTLARDGIEAAADIARAFQDAVVDTLSIKCRRALQETGVGTLLVAGGVGANQAIRCRLDSIAHASGARLFVPPPALCTDNGAMVAYAGAQRLLAGEHANLSFEVAPRWPLDTLTAPG